MEKLYSRPKSLNPRATGYCPGCLHGVATRLICELMDEFDVQEKTTSVLPIGCSSMGIFHFDTDIIVSLHGRAPAVATGVNRSDPDRFVYTYQGDGDLAAIGLSEIMHAANRGENITAIFVNNSIYGMTGGQMAPTTLVGQKATTAQDGRNPQREGYPMKMCEILSQLEAPVFIARCALDTPAHIREAKKALRQGFQNQIDKKGFSFIELMSNCPTNWGMSAEESIKWMEENTLKTFPLGVFKTKE